MTDLIKREDAKKALSRGEGCGNICCKAIDRIPAVNEILGKPKAYGEGKAKLMRFIDHIVPDDFEVKHFSMTFNDDGSANIYLSNNDYEDGEKDA